MNIDQEYNYFVHIAFRYGYRTTLPVSRRPEPNENIEEWLLEECELSRTSDQDIGLLNITDFNDVALVCFHREPKLQEEPEVKEESVKPKFKSTFVTVETDDDDVNVMSLEEAPPEVQRISEEVAKMIRHTMKDDDEEKSKDE